MVLLPASCKLCPVETLAIEASRMFVHPFQQTTVGALYSIDDAAGAKLSLERCSCYVFW